jgi:hypothetical protein
VAEETEIEGQIQDTPDDQQTAENTTEEVEAGSPPVQQEDWQGKLRAAEERAARQEERSRYLEENNRLLQEFTKRSQPQPQEASLSPELSELDKTLEPLFNKRLRSVVDPLQQQLANALDGQDALKFEQFLSRNHPDVFESEDNLNRTFQQVEWVRQQAAQIYGKYLSRVDAFLYAQGIEGVKEKSKARQSKRQTQVKEEAKRQLQVQATQSGEGRADSKRAPGADIDAIRRRMMAGDKLTPDEKAKFRKHLENAKF